MLPGNPWRSVAPSRAGIGTDLSALVWVALLAGLVVVGGFFAQLNLRRGRGDARGAWRLAGFSLLLNSLFAVLSYHFAPRPQYLNIQILLLGVPLLFAAAVWIGYMAVEPYARRNWPKLMVSWQRLLNGGWRDPMVGRDVLLGLLAGAAMSAVLSVADAWVGMIETLPVDAGFGQGIWPTLGTSIVRPSTASVSALVDLAFLSIATGILRKKWLGVGATGLLLLAQYSAPNPVDVALTVLWVAGFLAILTQGGLVATVSAIVIFQTIASSPPLVFSQWYTSRAILALAVPVAMLFWGFYASLAGKPIFGSALSEN